MSSKKSTLLGNSKMQEALSALVKPTTQLTRLPVDIPAEYKKALKHLATDEDTTMKELVTEAIYDYLIKKGEPVDRYELKD